jgi:hypothetical protein
MWTLLGANRRYMWTLLGKYVDIIRRKKEYFEILSFLVQCWLYLPKIKQHEKQNKVRKMR